MKKTIPVATPSGRLFSEISSSLTFALEKDGKKKTSI